MFMKSICTCLTFASLVVLMLAGSTGCQLFPDRPEWPTKLFGNDEEAVVPTRMMVMWTDTVLHQPQKSGVRGFGGRIYFYREDGPDPVKVDGGLAVYAFDADDLNPKSAKPKRKFLITADQFAEHMSHTSMGASYSVWCPWDEVGGYNEQLSLIVRFEGRSGGVVISDPTVKLLPGLNKPAGVAEASRPNKGTIAQAASSDATESSTQLAGFKKVSSGSTSTKPPRRQTETIDLPPSFYRHLKGPTQPIGSTPPPVEAAPVEPALIEPESLGTDSNGAEIAEPKQDATTSTKSASRSESRADSRWASYPRRTLGDKQLDASSEDTRRNSLSSGWIPQLPKTPRYGYPNSRSEDIKD